MKNWIKILIVALCLTASLASHTQTTTDLKPDETQSHFSFSASLLTRGELRDGGMTASWSPMPEVSLSAGYSLMRGSKTMEYLKRTDGNRLLQWAWLSLGFSPTLFKK